MESKKKGSKATKSMKRSLIIMYAFVCIVSLTLFFAPSVNGFIINTLASLTNTVIGTDGLMVHFISVGQGDGMAINLPDGKIMIIDTGTKSNATNFVKYIDEHVVSNSKSRYIDYLILTHADADHSGGIIKVMQKYSIGTMYIPTVSSDTEHYQVVLEYWDDNDIDTVYTIDGINLSGDNYEIIFYGPLDTYTGTNERSPVIKITYMGYSFLFTGDISENVEKDLLLIYGNELDADVLKVAHHGSKYSSCFDFVAAVSPEYAVISVGSNSYGHPTDVAINNIVNAGAKEVFRTDLAGNILFMVSNRYDLKYFTGTYNISGLNIDYKYIVITADAILFICIFVIHIKGIRAKHDK